LAGFYIIDKLYKRLSKFFGRMLHIKGPEDLAALPLLLLLISVLSFASDPITNAVSRYQENAADRYGIELTGNREAAIETFQDLADTGLSR
ncbi:M48 family metalloprotease, partial [Paenibacillus amylolyticus]